MLLYPDTGSDIETYTWSGKAKSAAQALRKAQAAGARCNSDEYRAEDFGQLVVVPGNQYIYGPEHDLPKKSPTPYDRALDKATRRKVL